MASPTFAAVSNMNTRRVIEPGSAASEPEAEQAEEGTQDMPRRKKEQQYEYPMPPGPEREERIVALYQEGLTTKEIREAVGLTYDSAIYLALKNAGITPNRNGPYAPRGSKNGTSDTEPTWVPEPDELELVAEPEVTNHVVVVPVATVLEMQTEVEAPAPDPLEGQVETYILHVTMMQPVTVDVEVDVASFDEAVKAAHSLPGLVSILGVVRSDAVKHGDGEGEG